MRSFRTASLAGLLAIFGFAAATAASKDIVDTAVEAGSFNTFASALEVADLVETLKGDGPYTVFAPTDQAFAKLPEGAIEFLFKRENRDQLIAVLTHHVVAGEVTAKEVVEQKKAFTVNGQTLDIMVDGSTVKVDYAEVIEADVKASNGVIHVIDTVILPVWTDPV